MNKKSTTSLISLILCVIMPSFILIYFKSSTIISPVNLLLMALCFPLSNALYELFNEKKVSLISVLGFASIFFTGLVGVLALDPQWIAVKEAFIPFAIFLFLFISAVRKKPAIGFLINQILDQEKIDKLENNYEIKSKLKKIYTTTTFIVSFSFILSSVLNYILAKLIVKSIPGTAEFNHELGVLTAMSYPVIVIPSMIVLALGFLYLFTKLKKLTGLNFSDLVKY